MQLNGITPLQFDGVVNARTYINTPTVSGATIRPHTLLRSARWDEASAADFDRLHAHGYTTMVDLRLPAEAAALPDRKRAFIKQVNAPFAADAISAQLLPISAYITHMQAHHDGHAQMMAGYRQMVANVDYQTSVAQALTAIFTAPGGVVFHCSRGKDRTGVIAALVLDLLGVSRADIFADYLYSNVENAGHILNQAAHFQSLGADADVTEQLLAMAQTSANYLTATFAWITAHYGSTAAYLQQGLKLAPTTIAAGRRHLLNP